MNVDRARFLLLTTALSAATAVALSAAGCTVKSEDTDGGTVTPPYDASTDAKNDTYYVDGSGDASVCLDDTGAAPSCAGAATNCSAVCDHYLLNYKKGVARSIADCIVKLPTCEGALTEISNCVQKALGAACPDPTAEGYCDPLVTACAADGGAGGDAGAPNLDKTECKDLASGLSSAGRTAFTTCIQEGAGPAYCKGNPTTCIDTIE